MEVKGGSVMLGLLLILAVLCHSGHSLRCYQCIKPFQPCTRNETCAVHFDTCLIVLAEKNRYFQCWRTHQCSFSSLSSSFGEKSLKYHCCARDLCNKDPALADSVGKAAPLVALLLAVAWSLCL